MERHVTALVITETDDEEQAIISAESAMAAIEQQSQGYCKGRPWNVNPVKLFTKEAQRLMEKKLDVMKQTFLGALTAITPHLGDSAWAMRHDPVFGGHLEDLGRRFGTTVLIFTESGAGLANESEVARHLKTIKEGYLVQCDVIVPWG